MTEEPTVTPTVGADATAGPDEVEPEVKPGVMGSGYTAPTTPIIPTSANEPTPLAAKQFRSGPSIPTVLWGVIAALVAAGAITREVSGVDLNLGIVAPLVLLSAGVVLVVWGVAGFGRPRRT
jgi:hypothetical protein